MPSRSRRAAASVLLLALALTGCDALARSQERTVGAPLPSEHRVPAPPTRSGRGPALAAELDPAIRTSFERTERAVRESAALYTNPPMPLVEDRPGLRRWARPAQGSSSPDAADQQAEDHRAITHWSTASMTDERGVTDQLDVSVTPGPASSTDVSLVASSVQVVPGSTPSGLRPEDAFTLRLTSPSPDRPVKGKKRAQVTALYGNRAQFTLPRPATGRDAVIRLDDDFAAVRTTVTRDKASFLTELARQDQALERAALAAVPRAVKACPVVVTCHPQRPDAQCGNVPVCEPLPLTEQEQTQVVAAVKAAFGARRAAREQHGDAWWSQLHSAFLWDRV